MKQKTFSKYPDIHYLREKARRKIPRFAFEYIDGGCNTELNLRRNTEELREIRLKPVYIQKKGPPSLDTNLFGETYSAPFGIAPRVPIVKGRRLRRARPPWCGAARSSPRTRCSDW